MALTSPGVIKAANEILVGLAPEVNVIKQFQFDISDVVADYGAKIRVAMIDGGTAENYGADNCADTNTGNYGHTTGSLSDFFVTLDAQPKSTIKITSTDKLELPNDSFWARAAEAGKNSIGKAISTKIGGLFTTENCAAGKITMASVTKNALAKLRTNAAGKGRVADYVLMLDPEYFADALSLFDSMVYGGEAPIQGGVIPNLYGFKAVVCGYDLPAGVKGVLVPSNGLAIAVRPVAIPDPSAYPECSTVTDENTGFSVLAMRHTDFNTGASLFNVTTLIGADLSRKNDTFYIAAS
jgi:hypothetical protein